MSPNIAEFVQQHPRLLVISGAGISAQSGIPTYRDDSGTWQRSEPILHQQFIDHLPERQRYWSRSAAGWPLIDSAEPNAAHLALVELERRGCIPLLVTQNVDRLHQRAGHQNVIDLHGRIDQVSCRQCQRLESRNSVQKRLILDNPILANITADMAPDGDAELDETIIGNLSCPSCVYCNGTLMPNVVFFGGSVPKQRVTTVMENLQAADALMIVGSSVMVHSGFRFCKAAKQLDKPIAIINRGTTRADDIATIKVEEDCATVLCALLVS